MPALVEALKDEETDGAKRGGGGAGILLTGRRTIGDPGAPQGGG